MTYNSDIFLKQLHRRYTWARLKHASFDSLPVLLIVSAMLLLQWSWQSASLGLLLASIALTGRFLGGSIARGVGPAMAWAWIPLLTPTLAMKLGHVCTPDYCHSLCRLACSAGGVVGGFLIARSVIRLPHKLRAWLVAGSMMLVAAVAGCQCVGWSSLASFSVAFLGASAAGRFVYLHRPALKT